MHIIDGEQIANSILLKLKDEISLNKLFPRLEIIFIGEDFASSIYVDKKKKAGEKIGIEVNVQQFESITEEKLIHVIENLNKNEEVHGVMIQLPIKGHKAAPFLKLIDSAKDVDGLSPLNLGLLWQADENVLISATPLSTLECINHIAIFSDDEYSAEDIDAEHVLKTYLSGKNITIINRSNIVGKPLAALLLRYDATVTLCHSKTQNIKSHLENADIIISGTGKPGFLNKANIPNDSILIDIGINDSASGLGGDIDISGCEDRVKWYTPVPGGVGPITIACLMRNVVKACITQNQKK